MKELFTKNIGAKLLTLILSLTLWFFITIGGQSEMMLEVPIEYKNILKEAEIIRASTKSVSISIQGHERIIKNLRPGDTSVYIDLNKVRDEGKTVYYISSDDIKIPPTLNVKKINPSSITLVIEKIISKTVDIKPAITGKPETGYFVKDVEIIPKKISIEGTKSIIEKIKSIKTETIDVTNKNTSFEVYVRMNHKGKNIKSETKKVTVKITIAGRAKEGGEEQ